MRILLFAMPRTGTTFFRSIINKSRNMYFYGEVFYPDYFPWGYFSYLKTNSVDTGIPSILTNHIVPYFDSLTGLMEDAGKNIIGFDLKIPQINLISDFHSAITPEKFSIIHLKRKNTLNTLLSIEIMNKRNLLRIKPHGTNTPPKMKVYLEPKSLITNLKFIELCDEVIENIYINSGRFNSIQIEYEKITSTFDDWKKIEEFTGVASIQFENHVLVRQNPNLAIEKIENHNEIKDLLNGSKYFNMLYSESGD